MNSYNIYRGSAFQKGYGLGGNFRKFFSWIVPIIKKHALPVVETGIKELGKKALITASDIARDVASGKNLKTAAEININRSVEDLKNQIERKLEGGSRKKRKRKNKFVIVKKPKRDIFD